MLNKQQRKQAQQNAQVVVNHMRALTGAKNTVYRNQLKNGLVRVKFYQLSIQKAIEFDKMGFQLKNIYFGGRAYAQNATIYVGAY